MSRDDFDSAFVERLEAAIRARDAHELPNGEVAFRCTETIKHEHGDVHPSARWNREKAVWHCDVCGAGGGVLDLARRLDVPLPERERGHRRSARGGKKTCDNPEHIMSRETVYEIRDAAGALVAEHIRRDFHDGCKNFLWRRNGKAELGGLPVADLPLYGAEEVGTAPPGTLVVLVEGEKARCALKARGHLAVGTVTGAAATPSPATLAVLAGHDVVLWPDNDGQGRAHMERIAAHLVALGVAPKRVRWDEAPDGGDAADFPADEAVLAALLREARPLGSFADVLTGVETLVARYVVMSPAARCAVTLWIAHTHALDAFDVTPYLHITSPEKRSGKTRLMEVSEALVRRPWRVVRPSEPVFFRKIARDQPTILLDEVDAIFHARGKDDGTEGLRAALNAGFGRGAVVSRCHGKDHELKDFAVFCAKALGGIGSRSVPDTVADRSIPIRLVRKKKAELVAKFRRRPFRAEAEPLHNALAAWGTEVIASLRTIEPVVPDALNDRAADAWEPLLGLADIAGGDWPARARRAAVELHGAELDGESVGVQLLRAIFEVFGECRTDRLITMELLKALVEREAEPWGSWWGKDVEQAKDGATPRGPAAKLAALLRPFAITPRDVRTPEGTRMGYYLADFADAFERYLSPSPSPGAENPTTRQPAPDAGLRHEAGPDVAAPVGSSKSTEPVGTEGLSGCRDFQGGGNGRGPERASRPPSGDPAVDDVEEGDL